ncbi:MAG: hypothetical protein ACREK7_10190 [Gemmatimonadota bacterium]
MDLVLNLVGGLIGGNIGGLLARSRNPGVPMNSILGIVGGVILGLLTSGGTGAEIGAGGLGGAILPIIAAFFKKKSASAT